MPISHKHAVVRPRLKKQNLDPDDVKSYRPVSNLSYLSKLIERSVAKRLTVHLEANKLLPPRQSAYRQFHSTETTVIGLHNDLIRAADDGCVTALVLLDLSSAFDTVDHDILVRVLHERFGIRGTALQWFESYIANRTQTFVVGKQRSACLNMDCGVPQGSVLDHNSLLPTQRT